MCCTLVSAGKNRGENDPYAGLGIEWLFIRVLEEWQFTSFDN